MVAHQRCTVYIFCVCLVPASLLRVCRELEEFDNELDDTQSQMNMVLKKIDKLLKSSDKGRLCCIVVLFIIAIILLFAIIYG